MSHAVIRCVVGPDGLIPDEPLFLLRYDPEAHGGRGASDWTTEIKDALHFASSIEAVEEYRRIPRARPVRPDGKPNRPLTAFTVEIRLVED